MNGIHVEVREISHKLSDLIIATILRVNNEKEAPTSSADRSNDFIIDGENRVKLLRRIREEFENEMSK